MKTSLVVTTIARPTREMLEFAAQCVARGFDFVVVGDTKTPADFALRGCDYYSVDRQLRTGYRYAAAAPIRHYARKNIGYLVSISSGADIIVESDDDNLPLEGFWSERQRMQKAHAFDQAGWLNVYTYFSAANVWPRGFPLDEARKPMPPIESARVEDVDCPIQQGLCNGDPDVDAIYRLVNPLPIDFQNGASLALGPNSWCPFNSQNTTWWPDAFPLLYLPGTCSIRMTDIWRSFVAQRIAWANGWSILFHAPTVYQDRNPHNLMRDFKDEISGYLNNRDIAQHFENLALEPGAEKTPANLRRCYEELERMGLVETHELRLLDAWLADLAEVEASGDLARQVVKC